MASLTLLRITQQLPSALRRRLEEDLSLLQQQISNMEKDKGELDEVRRELALAQEGLTQLQEDHDQLQKDYDHGLRSNDKFVEREKIRVQREAGWREKEKEYLARIQSLENEEMFVSDERPPSLPLKCTCRICGLHKRLGYEKAQKDCPTCRLRPCHQDAQQKQARRDRYKEIGKKGGIAKHKNGRP